MESVNGDREGRERFVTWTGFFSRSKIEEIENREIKRRFKKTISVNQYH